MLKYIKVLINIIYFVQIQNNFETNNRFDVVNVFGILFLIIITSIKIGES